MAKQVSARLKGDDYQIRFFWYKAAEMLRQGSIIEKISLERDDVSLVDDVGVHYITPGLKVGLENILDDYYQVKYQVSQKRSINIDNLLDPAFFNTKESFLKRLYTSYQNIHKSNSNLRMHLVNNYSWDSNDKTLEFLDAEGHFRDSFFNGTSRSKVGKIRKRILDHLNIDEHEGKEFLSKVNFEHGFLSSNNLRHWICDRFLIANLYPYDSNRLHSPYDDLGRKFIENGKQEFTAEELRSICEEEGLILTDPTIFGTRIGIKSFKRYAEDMGAECTSHLDLTGFFEKRYIINQKSWNGIISKKIRDFLSLEQLKKLSEPLDIRMDAHLSISFLSGYLLDSKTGINVRPIQKDSTNGFQLWNYVKDKPRDNLLEEEIQIATQTENLAIVFSISHEILDDVKAYCNKHKLKLSLAHFKIFSGSGIKCVEDNAHAYSIADEFQRRVLHLKNTLNPKKLHFFMAAPCALVFLLGQRSRGFGEMIIYEFDFEQQKGGSYFKGISIPNINIE